MTNTLLWIAAPIALLTMLGQCGKKKKAQHAPATNAPPNAAPQPQAIPPAGAQAPNQGATTVETAKEMGQPISESLIVHHASAEEERGSGSEQKEEVMAAEEPAGDAAVTDEPAA